MRVSALPEPQTARYYYPGEYCPLACETTINYVTFNDTDPSLLWKVNACRSAFRISSLYLCFDEFCKRDGTVSAWIQSHNHSCLADANITLPSLPHVVDQWKPEDRDRIERLPAAKALSFPSMNHTVLPDNTLFDRAFITVVRNQPVSTKIVNEWLINLRCRKPLTGSTKSTSYMGEQTNPCAMPRD